MQEVSKLLHAPKGLRALQEVAGECEKHGACSVLVHVKYGSGWYCPICREDHDRAEGEARALRERAERMVRTAQLPERYQHERFEARTPAQKQVRATARAFRDTVVASRGWCVLLQVGMTGTGKSLLACELSRSLLDASLQVRYCTANQMLSEIQAAYSQEGKTEESEVRRFSRYDVLVLDEIDAIRSSENAVLLLTEVVNRRYNARLPIIAISNQPIERLAKFVGDRVFSRLQENSLLCAHDWEDQRVARA
jgi:DNA replication protein DnaC